MNIEQLVYKVVFIDLQGFYSVYSIVFARVNLPNLTELQQRRRLKYLLRLLYTQFTCTLVGTLELCSKREERNNKLQVHVGLRGQVRKKITKCMLEKTA